DRLLRRVDRQPQRSRPAKREPPRAGERPSRDWNDDGVGTGSPSASRTPGRVRRVHCADRTRIQSRDSAAYARARRPIAVQLLHEAATSTGLATAILHRRSRFAIDLALANRVAFVVRLLALCEAYRELDAASLVIEAERHERHAPLDGTADQF